METFQEVLLTVWREACRRIRIDDFLVGIAPRLAPDLPLERIWIARVDAGRRRLSTLAIARSDDAAASEDIENVRPRTIETLNDRRRAGDIMLLCPEDPVREELFPDDDRNDLLLGPLDDDAWLAMTLRPDESTRRRSVDLARSLLEPFSAALANHRQLLHIETLHAAAEADKRALLTKLGRRKLGDTIIGASTGLSGVMQRVELVATSDLPVLILGETGAGKELIARTIHNQSPRRERPILRVNCGAIPPELIDTELFGHEAGAFTGATRQRQGWFERADGGTLFLDEIGELPPAAQVRLLRVLQDGWLERVGGQGPVQVDVRIVAATHRDLARMVAERQFREDLWYRISVFPLVLPPLRERREDIPELARHFAERAAVRFGLPATHPTPDDIALLRSYDWPGNIRELAAVIDRAAILGNGNGLEIATSLGHSPPIGRRDDENSRRAAPDSEDPFLSLDGAIRRHIEKGLAATNGRIEGPHGVAALLQVNPHTLRTRMRKLGIDWRRFREPS